MVKSTGKSAGRICRKERRKQQPRILKNSMDILDFKIFRLLYLLNNTAEVSRQLYLSSPAVSYRLTKMQEELGVELYSFNGKYNFTKEGKEFFEAAETILVKFDDTVTKFDRRGVYTISLSTAASFRYAPRVFKLLRERGAYPVIMTGDSMTAMKDVIEGTSKVAIVGGLRIGPFKRIVKKEIDRENIVLMYPQGFIDDLAHIPVLLDEPRSGLHELEKEYLAGYPETKILGESGLSLEKLAIAAAAGAGCFLPERSLAFAAQDAIAGMLVSSKYGFSRSLYLIYREEDGGDETINAIIKEFDSGRE